MSAAAAAATPAPAAAATPTARLAAEVGAVDHDRLPAPVRTVARQCLLDLVGVAVAGASSPGPSIVADVVAGAGSGSGFGPGHGGGGVAAPPDGAATVIGRGRAASARDAALANGVAAHVLDYDDVLPVMNGHPSATVVPAALAVAERLDASGTELLAAVVAGIETSARVGASVAPAHDARGFHTTGTAGAVGAAAACARLHRLDAGRTETALGLAVAQAAGVKCMFGSMAKSLHAGHAAAAGVLAAELAASGFTSGRDALAAEQGFGAAFAGGADHRVLGAPFGEPWYVLDTIFKVHAACYYANATIEAMLAARASVPPASVESVELAVHPVQLATCRVAEPTTPLEGKFSLPFAGALALVRGRAGEPDFSPSSLADPEVARLRARVRVVADRAVGPLACRAVVRTADGAELVVERDGDRRGWEADPAEQDDRLLAKFRELARPVLGAGRCDEVAAAVRRLGSGGRPRALLALLAAGPARAARPAVPAPARAAAAATATSRRDDRVGAG